MAVGMRANYTFPNMSGGADTLLVGTASALPMFIPMFLFFVWMTVFIGGTLAQQRRTGTSDFPMWSTMASISTLLIAMPLTLVSGLIGDQSTITLSVVVILTIFSGLWLFLSQSRGEV